MADPSLNSVTAEHIEGGRPSRVESHQNLMPPLGVCFEVGQFPFDFGLNSSLLPMMVSGHRRQVGV